MGRYDVPRKLDMRIITRTYDDGGPILEVTGTAQFIKEIERVRTGRPKRKYRWTGKFVGKRPRKQLAPTSEKPQPLLPESAPGSTLL